MVHEKWDGIICVGPVLCPRARVQKYRAPEGERTHTRAKRAPECSALARGRPVLLYTSPRAQNKGRHYCTLKFIAMYVQRFLNRACISIFSFSNHFLVCLLLPNSYLKFWRSHGAVMLALFFVDSVESFFQSYENSFFRLRASKKASSTLSLSPP